jgi:gamma-F420-2:alpha-L-glutamate ligase
MKIALVTTLPSLVENKRIEQEVKALHHEFKLINLQKFSFFIKNNKIDINGLEDFDADLVIVRGIFNSMKPIASFIEDLRRKNIKVFDNNFSSHKYSINKINDLFKLSLAGVSTPDTAYVRTFEDYLAVADRIKFPLVFKSTRMGKGVGVYKLDNKQSLQDLLKKLDKDGKSANSYIMQQFIDYQYDLRCLIIGSDVFTMRRIPGEGEFRANFSLGGDVELFDLDEQGRALAKKALHSIDMTVGGVDVLIDKNNNKYILEVNHTAGMVGMEKATGENITKIYVNHAIKHAL